MAGATTGGTPLGDHYQLSLETVEALTKMGETLAAPQKQLDPLAGVALPSGRVLDRLTASEGGTCLYLREECCFHVNRSGQVQQNIQGILESASKIKNLSPSINPSSCLPSMTWLLPFLGPLFSILLLLMLSPCIFNLLVTFISSRLEQFKNHIGAVLVLQLCQPGQAQAQLMEMAEGQLYDPSQREAVPEDRPSLIYPQL